MNQNPNLLETVRHGTVMFPLEYYHCVFPLGISNLTVHWHKEFEITLVQKGSCTYQIDLKTYEIREGDVLLLPPEMLHGTGEEPKEEFITDSFVFCLDMLESQRTDSCTPAQTRRRLHIKRALNIFQRFFSIILFFLHGGHTL